jgi:hypothetical protein
MLPAVKRGDSVVKVVLHMTTGRPIDHVVLAVRDLDRSAALFEAAGFMLTPRALHDDRMGTSNRLIQFRGRNSIEVLAVDRPDKLARHDFSYRPPFFGFGDHHRLALEGREGLSMLVFATDDARADIIRFEAAGLQAFQPFDFERSARLPGGAEVTVAFTLAYTLSPHMPGVALAVCQNQAPEFLWKAEYQLHANGAQTIHAVYLISPAPERDAAFIGAMFGGEVAPVSGGIRVSCGPAQEVRVLSLQALTALDPAFDAGTASPVLAGIGVSGTRKGIVPASQACGMFIEWGR